MLHIVPINDDQEHEQTSTCHCQPGVIEHCGVLLIVHNAFDGRVGVEVVNEILYKTS